jgi:hypothetical protein
LGRRDGRLGGPGSEIRLLERRLCAFELGPEIARVNLDERLPLLYPVPFLGQHQDDGADGLARKHGAISGVTVPTDSNESTTVSGRTNATWMSLITERFGCFLSDAFFSLEQSRNNKRTRTIVTRSAFMALPIANLRRARKI